MLHTDTCRWLIDGVVMKLSYPAGVDSRLPSFSALSPRGRAACFGSRSLVLHGMEANKVAFLRTVQRENGRDKERTMI